MTGQSDRPAERGGPVEEPKPGAAGRRSPWWWLNRRPASPRSGVDERRTFGRRGGVLPERNADQAAEPAGERPASFAVVELHPGPDAVAYVDGGRGVPPMLVLAAGPVEVLVFALDEADQVDLAFAEQLHAAAGEFVTLLRRQVRR